MIKKFFIALLFIALIGLYFLFSEMKVNGNKKYVSDPKFTKYPLETQDDVYPYLQNIYGDSLKSFTVETIPVDLPANLSHPGLTILFEINFPEDGNIVGFEVRHNANKGNLHHFDFIDTFSRHPFCNDTSVNTIYAAGEELTPFIFPAHYGYPFIEAEEFRGLLMWHNEFSEPFEDAQAEIVFYYVTDQSLQYAHPFILDVLTDCGEGDFTVGKDELYRSNSLERDTELTITKDVRVLAFGAHAHDGFSWLDLTLNGESIYRFEPVYAEIDDGRQGHSYEGKHLDKIRPTIAEDFYLKVGDKIGIDVLYDNKGREEQNDAMAMILFLVEPLD